MIIRFILFQHYQAVAYNFETAKYTHLRNRFCKYKDTKFKLTVSENRSSN